MLGCLPMLKYFVMGIKAFIAEKNCKTCGILIPSAWKYCKEHGTHIPWKKKEKKPKVIPKIKTSIINQNLYSHLEFHCNKEKALESEILVYDENMYIIGYYSPLQALNR